MYLRTVGGLMQAAERQLLETTHKQNGSWQSKQRADDCTRDSCC